MRRDGTSACGPNQDPEKAEFVNRCFLLRSVASVIDATVFVLTWGTRLIGDIRLGAPKLSSSQSLHNRSSLPVLTLFYQPHIFQKRIPTANMAAQNSYFVPGFGISRTVIQNEIRYHCGPDAIVRPYTFQVRCHHGCNDVDILILTGFRDVTASSSRRWDLL
jgi:hypothetical protein